MCCFHLIESSSYCVSHGVAVKRVLIIEGLKFTDVVKHSGGEAAAASVTAVDHISSDCNDEMMRSSV